MELNEAKKILGSVGYSVNGKSKDDFKKTVKDLMESMESRNATRTKAYQILSEMARFNGRYTGSFSGLENAGTVNLTVRGASKEFGLAEALSKVENDFKSANSKGMSQKTAETLLANFDAALAAFPESGNQEYLSELQKERAYISQCVEEGEGIPQGRWTDEAQARTTHSRDDNALTPSDIIRRISSSISSFRRGGNNADEIRARIDALAAREAELTAEEKEKVNGLYVKLDIATGDNANNQLTSGRIAVFKPNEGVSALRIRTRLNSNEVDYTENEDGTFTIRNVGRKKNVDVAKRVLADFGEFINPAAQAPEAPADENRCLKFANPGDVEVVIEDILPSFDVSSEVNGPYILITAPANKLDAIQNTLDNNGAEYEVVDEGEFLNDETPAEVAESRRVNRLGNRILKETVEIEDSYDNFLDVAARLTDYGSI